MSNCEGILCQALSAGEKAYSAQWEREGRKDAGFCGSAYVEVHRTTPLAKHALKSGKASSSGFTAGYVTLKLTYPAEIGYVQSMNINEARAKAVVEFLKAGCVDRVHMYTFRD